MTNERAPLRPQSDRSEPDEGDAVTTSTGESRGALRAIAIFKTLKALVLIVAGLGAFGLVNDAWNDAAVGWLDDLALHEGRRFVARAAHRASDMLGDATPRRFMLIGLASFAYAAIFVTEGVGLWLGKRWAEYLTLFVTGSFLPVEVIELMKHNNAMHWIALLLNVVVVVYLVVVLLRKRGGRSKESGAH